jgi:pyrimidine-nucleoside phosphorylase
MLATEVIKAKREGLALSKDDLQFFIQSYTNGALPDYQMSALLMAIFLKGMNFQETLDLTQAMLDSGERVEFPQLFPIDKHSTGGVGDKTSLLLAPIAAACGVPVPMMSGRGLGHTGGTLDKLESIPGFNVHLDLPTFKNQVETLGLCFIGQTQNICPADKKIYALRDVTGTVESLPLICASIMSKKIAEGIKGLVLDVKVGSGAFMKSLEEAQALAESLISIGEGHGLKTQALITDMSQPLGSFVGNAVEVGECLSILKREDFMGHRFEKFHATETLSLELSAMMISMNKNIPLDQARSQAREALDSGKAYELFEKVCAKQGGDIQKLNFPTQCTVISAEKDGFLASMNCEKIGVAGIEMGAGRKKVTDTVDPIPGIEICVPVGGQIHRGEPLFKIHHTSDTPGLSPAQGLLSTCFQISDSPVEIPPLIQKRLS